MEQNNAYKIGFIPYALAAFLIGIVGGFSTVLGPSFVQDIGIEKYMRVFLQNLNQCFG